MVQNPPASARVTGGAVLIPESGRSPGGGNGNPLQYSCLENPMHRGARRATVQGLSKSWTRLERLSTHTDSTGKTIQCRGTQEYLAMEKAVKVYAKSLCSHSHPSHSHLLCSALCPGATSTCLLPSSFWLESLSGNTSRRMREERKQDGESVYLVPSLQDCCPLTVP